MENIMKHTILSLITLFPMVAMALGGYPTPKINTIEWRATANYNADTGRYLYTYKIISGEDNIGEIDGVLLNIQNTYFEPSDPDDIPDDFILNYSVGPYSFKKKYFRWVHGKNTLPFKTNMEFVSTKVPEGWNSDVFANGELYLSATKQTHVEGVFTAPMMIRPGDTHENIKVTALSPPTLKQLTVRANWTYYRESDQYSDEEIDAFEQSLHVDLTTVGPEKIHLNHLHDRTVHDMIKMIALGWVHDEVLMTQWIDLMNEAKQLIYDNQGTQAKAKYQILLDQVAMVTTAQLFQEAIDLIRINVGLVLDNTTDTPYQADYDLSITPLIQTLEFGQVVLFQPQIIDRNADNRPYSGMMNNFKLEVLSGPHEGLVVTSNDDESLHDFYLPLDNIGYRGTKVGTDLIEITRLQSDDSFGTLSTQAKITWTGGPDYVLSFFSPPFLNYPGTGDIYIADTTKNKGTKSTSVESTTRYYFSPTRDFDSETAFVLYERRVAGLEIDQYHELGFTPVTWPNLGTSPPIPFPPGRYYFGACADADHEIYELNEDNNCSFSQREDLSYFVGVVKQTEVINQPPICDLASASDNKLWPPNHQFHDVSIENITDPEEDEIIIEITSITQDEAVNAKGTGNTSPDAKGIGSSSAEVRAERMGKGDGRVYQVNFTASDSHDNQCQGSVTVSSVLHDQGKKAAPAIDSGQNYNSTEVF